jgi:hypothetical protein
MLARSQFRTCHSPNQRRKESSCPLGWEEQESTARCFFVGLNNSMITEVKISGLFIPKHTSPTGTDSGYFVIPDSKPIVPVINQPVKF